MANALPILLLGGAALMMMGGKKKKTGSTPDLDFDPESGPVIVPNDIPPPAVPKNVSMPYWKKAGVTQWKGNYDGAYWGSNGDERLEKIRKYFSDFGYDVRVGPWPMNVLGPAGTLELENVPDSDPAKGKLGGGDDAPSPVVDKFQREYNAVSKAKIFAPGQKMGGLAPDGLVGPYVLNGLRFVKTYLGGKLWQDLVREAAKNGSNA